MSAPSHIATYESPKPLRTRMISDVQNTSNEICVLCLRQCASGQIVRFSSNPSLNIHDVFQCRLQLQNTFNLNINLDEFAICRTCWKLMDLIQEFQQCCLKAEMCTNGYATGLKDKLILPETDTWLSDETFKMIARIHQLVQKHKPILTEKIDSFVAIEHLKIEINDDDDFVLAETMDDVKLQNTLRKDLNLELEEEEDTVQTYKSDIKIKACSKCNRKFDTDIGYKVHSTRCKGLNGTKSATSFVDCSICSASFTCHTSLKYHMNKHKGIKPYKCRQKCKNYFYSATSRKKHELHCGSETQICPVCGDQLKTRVTVANHMAHSHGEANINCEICEKKFKSRKKLKRHMLVHTNVRKYPCNVCGKAFKSSYAANVHQRIHTQEKPFTCEICGQGFTYKCSMKAHVTREHG